jgi:Tol biopolymer transport system component
MQTTKKSRTPQGLGWRGAIAGGVLGVACVTVAPPGFAQAPELISVQAGTNVGAGSSRDAMISGDGRFVTFLSRATTLVPGPASGFQDLYIRDRTTGVTERVSVGVNGALPNGNSGQHDVSYDGRYVVFESEASNLVPYDTNRRQDIFLRDRMNRTTRRLNLTEGHGQITDGNSEFPSITPSGRFVCFNANSRQVQPSAAYFNVVVHDLWAERVELANVWNNGVYLNASWGRCSLSADGRFVAFASAVVSLKPFNPDSGADESLRQIFVRDFLLDRTEVASVSSSGVLAKGQNEEPVLSDDGRYVFFVTYADDLVPNDTNKSLDVVGRDRVAKTTHRVSVGSGGRQLSFDSHHPSTSGDGRYVAFTTIPESHYTNQALVRDRVASSTGQVTQGGDDYFTSSGALSADGRYLAVSAYTTGDIYVYDRGVDGGYKLYLRPLAINYGEVKVGSVLKKGFTLTNAGNVPLPVTKIELRGVDRSQYTLKSGCGPEIEVGRWCWIAVTFAPTSIGEKRAKLHVAAGGLDRYRGLTGIGVR